MEHSQRPKSWMLFAISGVTLTMMVLALWLPYKFNIPAWSDDWIWISRADLNGLRLPNDPRPFAQIPSYIGYLLTPDSFVGTNIVVAVLLIAQCLAMYVLLRQLFVDNPAFAFIGGVLVTFFPGDVANFEMMTLYIHLTITAILLALNFLVILWKLSGPTGLPNHHNARRWLGALVGMCLSLALVYEVAFPIIFLSPVVLLWLEKKLNRRVIVVGLLWYIVPLILILRIAILIVSVPNFLSYQTGAISHNNEISSILNTLWIIYSRMFWSSWAYSVEFAPQGLSNPLTYIGLITFVVSTVVLWLHSRKVQFVIAWKTTLLILLSGVIIFFLGFMLYIPSVFRDSDFRTLLVSFMGAAIAAIAVIWIFTNLPIAARVVISITLFVLAIALFMKTDRFTSLIVLALAVGFLLKKQAHFAVLWASVISLAMSNAVGTLNYQASRESYAYQHHILQIVTESAPRFIPKTVILLTSPAGNKKPFEMLDQWRSGVLTAMLQYTYHDRTLNGYVCDTTDGKSGWNHVDCHLRKEYAEVDNGTAGGILNIPYDQIVIFDYEAGLLEKIPQSYLSDGEVVGYNPLVRMDRTASPPTRIQTVYFDNNDAVKRSR